jgi:hypothetical protein
MKGSVNTILAGIKENASLNSEPLVKILTDSIDKSISLGESEMKIYENLKSGLSSINKIVNNSNLTAILEQFTKLETTPDSKTVEIAKRANLIQKLQVIRESKSGSNPIISSQIQVFESYLNSGTPDFALCEGFIQFFSNHKKAQSLSTLVLYIHN